MIKEFFQLLKDKSILSAILFILFLEILFQFGIYNPLLKKNSYTANVIKITEFALSKHSKVDPDILILGTSLAYEGISLKLLNEKLAPLNLKAQTIAVPGAELIVQQLAFRKVLKNFKNVKYVIHLNEPEMPWSIGKVISLPTLAMASAFDKLDVIRTFQEHEFDLQTNDYAYLFFKLWAYRHDLGDFILYPQKRIKDYGRASKAFQTNIYVYENANLESLELYEFRDIEEAIHKTQSLSPIPVGSNHFHKEAIYKTFKIAKDAKFELAETDSTKLFSKRLGFFYNEIRNHNIKIINVFPPISNYVTHFQHEERIQFWETNFKKELGDKIIKLTDSIPKENNASYFYDAVHPNQKGMILFTEKLADELIPYFKGEAN